MPQRPALQRFRLSQIKSPSRSRFYHDVIRLFRWLRPDAGHFSERQVNQDDAPPRRIGAGVPSADIIKKGDEVTAILTNLNEEDLPYGFAIPKDNVSLIVNPQET